jgi:hypothetical protein
MVVGSESPERGLVLSSQLLRFPVARWGRGKQKATAELLYWRGFVETGEEKERK